MNNLELENSTRSLTLHDLWRMILGKWWFISGSIILGIVVSSYFNQTVIPEYKSSTLVLVKDQMAQTQAILQFRGMDNIDQQINNEKSILKSRKVTMTVIDTLMRSKQNLYILGKKINGDFEHFSWFVQLIAKIPGFEPRTHFVYQPKPISQWNDEDVRRSADKLRSKLQVSQISNTELISIAVSAPSPDEAALLSNTVAKIYQSMDLSRSRADVKGVKDFLTSRLNDVSVSLQNSEIALLQHQEKHGIVNISSGAEKLISQSSEFESEYLGAKTEIETLNKELEIQRNLLSETENALLEQVGAISSPIIEKLRNQIADLKASILTKDVNKSDAWVLSTRKQIKDLKDLQRIETEKALETKFVTINPLAYREDLLKSILTLESKIATLRKKRQSLFEIKQDFEGRLSQLPAKTLEYVRLERERQVNENVFLLLKTKFIEYGISEQTQLGSVQIIDTAVPNHSPISPNKQKNLILGILVGLVLSIVLLLIREVMDNTICSKRDLEEFGIPILGIVPFAGKSKLFGLNIRKNGSMKAFRNRLVSHFDSKSPISESYRHLRTGLHFIKHNNGLKTIGVLSSGPKEGKSATAINLGITYAQLDKKTIIVDSDLRRPIIHKVFRAKKTLGLSDVLNGDADLESVIVSTEIENLYILPCGTTPPNPSEILASESMGNLHEDLSQRFDKIIFDTPPINAVADGAIVSKKCDGSIFVVSSNTTHLDAFRHAIEYLRRIETNLLGLVLNGVKKHHVTPSHYYYYYGRD